MYVIYVVVLVSYIEYLNQKQILGILSNKPLRWSSLRKQLAVVAKKSILVI